MNSQLSVAVPWSLSHYIPLNGFHPLYRALFEAKPDWVQLEAWDNIKLSQYLRANDRLRGDLLKEIQRDTEMQKRCSTHIGKKYYSHFWAPNQCLTRLLPGDIEFHHTAPFPSLERPFVFHCESFAPVFFPFSHQGTGNIADSHALRAHYKAIFEHPLCLGIASHLPQTLEDLSRFFGSPVIDKRLFASRIGLHTGELVPFPAKSPLDATVFLFINSAHQNPQNFSLRGGHLVLRFWQSAYPEPGAERLIMRCKRPADDVLADLGVDLDCLRRQERRSVIWIEDYLTAAELDSLMQAAHVFLLPSTSLHSVSIMQAMAAGAVPVVTDTLGTDRYVTDAVDSVVLQGVYASNWRRDSKTGVMIDHYQRNAELDMRLVQQLVSRLGDLLADPARYYSLQAVAMSKAGEAFSGKAFSEDFWQQVWQRYQALPKNVRLPRKIDSISHELKHSLVKQYDWARIFTSSPQPVERLSAGLGRVTELGGYFIALPTNCSMDLHRWSPLAEYVDSMAPALVFAENIKGLGGHYLSSSTSLTDKSIRRRFIGYVAEWLMPYPTLYVAAAGFLKRLRRVHGAIKRYMPSWLQVQKSEKVLRSETVQVELLHHAIKGLNIIRCGSMFYAVPQAAGPFSVDRAQAGGYDDCIYGTNLGEVLLRVEKLPARKMEMEDVKLIDQDVHGFNIIRYAGIFYAIPMSEGAFDIERVRAAKYSCVYTGTTAEEVRIVINKGMT